MFDQTGLSSPSPLMNMSILGRKIKLAFTKHTNIRALEGLRCTDVVAVVVELLAIIAGLVFRDNYAIHIILTLFKVKL